MREYKKPIFTQKHYEAIARKIWHIIPETPESAFGTHYANPHLRKSMADWPLISRNLLINDLASMFKADNPEFDTERFKKACDYQPLEADAK